ncbi:HigA family addiction module antitoxin [Aquimarina agarilytica]|uniref:HigA family addiction module antitoxin n=1 Tax=Aquimarina agarilytica TaxID=1087449 RepID=UPI000288AFDF|nr:HigA family addiction module antitoxin [Aquimarina agarilytica]
MEKQMNVHPGEMLREDFLKPMGITAYKLAKSIGVSDSRVGKIVREEMGISGEMALRLSKFFGNSPEFWSNLQSFYEIRKAQIEKEDDINKIQPYTKQAV